eukprot:6238383-Pyramimonas_sp.AAC.1
MNPTARRRARRLKSGRSQSLDVLGSSADHGAPDAQDGRARARAKTAGGTNNRGLSLARGRCTARP